MTRRRQLNRFGTLVAAPAALALGGCSSTPRRSRVWSGRGRACSWDIQNVPKGPFKRTALGDTDAWSMWKNTKSALDHWVKVVRQRFPVLEKVNLKVVPDVLTTIAYLTPTDNFLCQTEAGKVVTPAVNQVMRDRTARPVLFRDIKAQIERTAASCGAT